MKLAAPQQTMVTGPGSAVRDKKTGGNYSAAGDDDINDVAAMGGVNLAEEANVSQICQIFFIFSLSTITEYSGCH